MCVDTDRFSDSFKQTYCCNKRVRYILQEYTHDNNNFLNLISLEKTAWITTQQSKNNWWLTLSWTIPRRKWGVSNAGQRIGRFLNVSVRQYLIFSSYSLIAALHYNYILKKLTFTHVKIRPKYIEKKHSKKYAHFVHLTIKWL